MGRRTRYQQRDVAQLTLKVDVGEEYRECPSQYRDDLPKDVTLNDEVRLAQVEFREGQPTVPHLTPVQQIVLLNTCLLLQRSQPHDELAVEELLPYLECVLSQPQWWSVQVTALVQRSRLEGAQRRAAERSMMQLQEVCSAFERSEPCAAERMLGVWAVGGAVSHAVAQSLLAQQLARLGCIQAALDLFLELHRWEDAVTCYTMLGLRHQAAELLRREVACRQSVTLLCLLGDATGEAEHYEAAWDLSEQRSARAQRHWALHHFNRKEYGASIPHLQLSLECNSLQPELWRCLGYAALDAQDWEACARAYRRCAELDPECLEAWNNVAKAYVHLGDKKRAWRAFQEALRIDFENWRLWENVLTVSADVGAFDEVIRAAHRLLDLRGSGGPGKLTPVDHGALRVLVRAVEENLPDCDGRGCLLYLRPRALELFGRLTASVSYDAELWRLYAALTASVPEGFEDEAAEQRRTLVAQRLLRAHRVAVQRKGWASQRENATATLATACRLVDAHLASAADLPEEQRPPVLSSARFAVKGALVAVKQGDLANELASELEAAEEKLAVVEEALTALRKQ